MRDELKLYAHRYNLGESGEPLKELFEVYNISESTEQLQVSETYSQVPEEGTRSSDDDVHSSSTVGTRKLKPRSLNTDATRALEVCKSAKQDTIQKKSRTIGTRGSLNKNSANSKFVSEPEDRKLPKKPEKPTKMESNKEDKIKQGKKSSAKAGKHT